MRRLQLQIFRLFNLRNDQDTPEDIDATIRMGVNVGGTNLWGLIGAILIASIGLNVNSTAVIIGAMLISPLMGPIVGIGYGIGIRDFDLILLSLRNLGIFIVISLLTATAYFLITPLNFAQSELLARTTPSLWDVLIAFIGGGLGMVGATRRAGSNMVPGVAIATALMPPLCTAGFGLATGNWLFFGGAFYLFTINSVFIAFASLLVVKLLRLPSHNDARMPEWKTKLLISATVLATALPSAYLAFRLVSQKMFEQTAEQVLSSIERDGRFVLLGREISPSSHRVVLTIGGDSGVDEVDRDVRRQFQSNGYNDVEVVIRNISSEKVDITKIAETLRKEMLQNTIQQLQDTLALNKKLEAENAALRQDAGQTRRVLDEIVALFPNVTRASMGTGAVWDRDTRTAEESLLVHITVNKALGKDEQRRLQAWLSTRLPDQPLRLQVTVER